MNKMTIEIRNMGNSLTTLTQMRYIILDMIEMKLRPKGVMVSYTIKTDKEDNAIGTIEFKEKDKKMVQGAYNDIIKIYQDAHRKSSDEPFEEYMNIKMKEE